MMVTFIWLGANLNGSGDRPLKEALILMNNEGVTSLAVVDNQYNVMGNISNADVKVRRVSIILDYPLIKC